MFRFRILDCRGGRDTRTRWRGKIVLVAPSPTFHRKTGMISTRVRRKSMTSTVLALCCGNCWPRVTLTVQVSLLYMFCCHLQSSCNQSVKPISQLRFDYDTTTILRYHDAFDYDESNQNYDMRSIRLRYDYDTTTTKNWHVHFLLGSNGSRCARYVVVGP